MKKILLALTIGLAAMGCRDREKEAQDQLPPITQTGANTAGCLVNGKVLIPKNGFQNFGGPPAYGLKMGVGNGFHPPNIGDDYIYFMITNYISTEVGQLYIYMPNLSNGVGKYMVEQSDGKYFPEGPNNPHMIYSLKNNNKYKVYYSSSNSGEIDITRFDYHKGVYSAIFSAELYNRDNVDDKIFITEGRLDIKVATLNK